MSPGTPTSVSAPAELDRILADGAVRSVYQPIVHLASGEIVAYEALARGPEGSPLERPDLLFAAAREAGRTTELDWQCRMAALRGALAADLPRAIRLFVNVAADAVAAPPCPALAAEFAAAIGRLDVVFEITEQAIADRPAEMLRAVDTLRRHGCALALDDVGAVDSSLALMPLIAPDVIKLDLRLVQRRATFGTAMVANAVSAQAERSGAQVIAEGIEDPEQIETALALGAQFGQGWLFGRPDALPAAFAAPMSQLRSRRSAPAVDSRTPFELVAGEIPLRRGDKALLLKISRQIEHHAVAQGPATILLSAFQDARHFTSFTADLYRAMADKLAFVGALAQDLPAEPTPGVRGASLAATSALVDEWNVVAIAPHFAAAFVARDLGDTGPDGARRFDFALTYDRDLAVAAARTLMRQIAPHATAG